MITDIVWNPGILDTIVLIELQLAPFSQPCLLCSCVIVLLCGNERSIVPTVVPTQSLENAILEKNNNAIVEVAVRQTASPGPHPAHIYEPDTSRTTRSVIGIRECTRPYKTYIEPRLYKTFIDHTIEPSPYKTYIERNSL